MTTHERICMGTFQGTELCGHAYAEHRRVYGKGRVCFGDGCGCQHFTRIPAHRVKCGNRGTADFATCKCDPSLAGLMAALGRGSLTVPPVELPHNAGRMSDESYRRAGGQIATNARGTAPCNRLHSVYSSACTRPIGHSGAHRTG